MEVGIALAVGQISAKLLSIIWTYYSDVKDAKKDIVSLVHELEDLRRITNEIKEMTDTNSSTSDSFSDTHPLLDTLREIASEMEQLKQKMNPGAGSKAMKRVGGRALKWPFTKKEADSCIQRLQRFKATLNLSLNVDQSSRMLDITDRISEMQVAQGASYSENLLKTLPHAPDACFDSYYQQHESQCLENTRVDLLRQLREWGMKHERRIFWLSGMAGTGKSTISRTLADTFHSEKILAGSFFFSRSSGEGNNARRFVGTLAHHLARTSKRFASQICEALANDADIVHKGIRTQWSELILKPLLKIKVSSVRPTLNFVIDALDECSADDDIRLLIQLFAELEQVTTIDVGVFVTSRPEIVIRLGFKKIPIILHHNLDLRDIPSAMTKQDIHTFVKHEIESIYEYHDIKDRPREEDLSILAKKAGVLFIYAATACRYIADTNWNPPHRLLELTRTSDNHIGETVQLDMIYSHVIRQSLVNGRHTGEATRLCNRFREIVGPIVILYDEMSPLHLSQLLRYPQESLKKCLDALHAILDVPDDLQSPIRLLHPSFRDYLVSEARCGHEMFHIEESTVHRAMYTRCLEALSKSLKRDICSLAAPGTSPWEVQKTHLDEALPKHIRYACLHWVNHLESAGSAFIEVEMCINSKVHEFLQRDLLHWLEAMGLCAAMTQAVLMITKLLDIAKNLEGNSLVPVIDDARKFTVTNRMIIELAPLQTYASALIFSPKSSVTRQAHIQSSASWIEILPKVKEDWGVCMHTLRNESYTTPPVFSKDDKYLVVYHSQTVGGRFSKDRLRSIDVWDPMTGGSHGSFEVSSEISSLDISANGLLASLSSDGTVWIWELATGAKLDTLDITYGCPHYERGCSRLAFTPDGDLVIGSYDRKVRVWNSTSHVLSEPLIAGCDCHWLIDVSKQENIVLLHCSRSKSDSWKLYDFAKGVLFSRDCPKTTTMFDSPSSAQVTVLELALSSRRTVLEGSERDVLKLVDTITGICHQLDVEYRSPIRTHPPGVHQAALSFSPDGCFFTARMPRELGDYYQTSGLWRISDGTVQLLYRFADTAALKFSPCGTYLATTGHNLSIFDLSQICQLSFKPSKGRSGSLMFIDNFSQVMVSSWKHNWTRTFKAPFSHVGLALDEAVTELGLKLSTSKRHIYTKGRDGVRTQSLDTEAEFWDVKDDTFSDLSLTSSQNGEYFGYLTNKERLLVWDTSSKHMVSEFQVKANEICRMGFLPNTKILWWVTYHNSGSIWDFENKREIALLTEVDRTSICSPHGSYIAFPAVDHTIILYRASDGAQLRTKATHPHVNRLAFSFDENSMATVSLDEIGIWDVKTRSKIHSISTGDGYIRHFAFSSDKTYLETDVGEIAFPQTPNSSLQPSNDRCFWRRNGLWIMEGDRRMLWLPLDYFIDSEASVLCHNGTILRLDESDELQVWQLTMNKDATYQL